ncbi:MAG TPA: FAD-dependent oxidoreductase [Acidimicrobiales bacterium]|nr:FAD-dependent oxidoreductase [Acidimicrobiales bacterium]
MFDAIVIGGGPAGLSAATWLSRYRRKVLVLDAGEHRNRWVEKAHGYLGTDPLAPKSFLEGARSQLDAYTETEIRPLRASAVSRRDDGVFTVEADGATLEARRLVLAVGVEDDFPEVENFFEHYGASVFHCPTCDGYEAKGCDVVAFGWSANLTGFALTLLGWAKTVTVVTDGRHFEGDEEDRRRLNSKGVSILEDDAVELIGERGCLEGVRLAGGGVLDCQLAFFSIAHRPRTALAAQLGCALTDEGCIEVDLEGATTVPGVYAAGDVTPGLQLVQVAAAKGAIAGVACAQSLQGKNGAVTDDDTQTERSETEASETEDSEPEASETEESEPEASETEASEPEAGTTEPEDPEERLEALGAEVQQVRQQVDEPLDEGDRSFVEKGEEEPVDDTIAPPG